MGAGSWGKQARLGVRGRLGGAGLAAGAGWGVLRAG